MARQLLYLMALVACFAGTTWVIFAVLNATGVQPWPAWVPH